MTEDIDDLAAQRRYARWLAWSTRLGMALLLASFAVYVTGIVPAHVPIEKLPEVWSLSAADMLRITGVQPGLRGWTRIAASGDMLVLCAIAYLISCSILCLAAVIPVFRKRGERLFVAVCVLQIAVLLFAGSGLLAAAR